MVDIIITILLIGALGLAIRYIVKAKKRGVKCIGCPEGCACSGKNGDGTECGCGCHSEK